MANQDIFGIDRNRRQRAEEGRAMFERDRRKRRPASFPLSMFGVERDEEFEEQENLHEQPSVEEAPATPEERQAAESAVKESLDRVRESAKKKKEEE